MTAKEIKGHLAAVFDDNLHTRKWHNVVDYIIIAVILISTLEIFLSTFDLSPELRHVLRWVDVATLIFFTIEVTLRIWVAPEINPKFDGWKGRLKYCFTFNGFVDVVSTYPYYLQWLIPFPIAWLKILRVSRVMRLFRISRYMKSWSLLTESIAEKRRELVISMQFLVVVTFILSLILFFFEHEAQPEVYDNGFTSVAWSFAQYIGDPGGFGETPPITIPGKIIACLVGLLGIAIVAVPAGILGAGFTESIEKESNKKLLEENREKLRNSFERKLDRPSGFQVVPTYRTLAHIQSRQGMTEAEIIEAVNETPGFRLVNLASTIPSEKFPHDALAVEHFHYNCPYGCIIDRGSRMTIIAPSSFIDDCTGFFAYYLAMIGGFNYVSREFGCKAPYRSWFIYKGFGDEEGEAEYFEDIASLVNREDAWSLTFLIGSGASEPEYPTELHFGTGNAKGDTTSIGDFITDKEAFQRFTEEVGTNIPDLKFDCDKYHSTANPKIFIRQTECPNNIVMRMAWSAALWNPRHIEFARQIALAINHQLLGNDGNPEVKELKVKKIGFE